MEKSNKGVRSRNPFAFLFKKDAEEGYVPNREALFFSMGLGGQNVTYNLVSGWFFYFCNNVLHISPGIVGTITGISRIWDGVNDPIVGALVDRRNTAPGQKLHQYLGKLPIIIGILTMLMFCDFGLPERAAVVVVLCIYLAWDMAYSFQDVALWGTLALVSPYSRERSRVAQWINIGTSVAGGVTGLIPIIMGVGRDAGIAEKWLFLGFGIVFGLGGELMSIFAAKTHERVLQSPKTEQLSLKENFKIFLHNRNLLLLGLAQIVAGLSFTVPQIYFFKYCVSLSVGSFEMNGETAMTVLGAIGVLPSIFGMFFAVKLAEWCGGMKNLLITNQVLSIIVRLIVFFIGYDSTSKLIIGALVLSVTSVLGVAQNIGLRSLITDSVDRMEWETGKRTEGLASSFQNFVAKITGALQLFISGLILEMLHFDNSLDGITGQPDTFYKWQWPLYILGPAMGALLYLIPAFFIKDNKQEKERIEAELAERRAKAAEEAVD